VPDYALAYVEWMDGRHGPAKEILPPMDRTPTPAVLSSLPHLHADRPRGSKAMPIEYPAFANGLGANQAANGWPPALFAFDIQALA
jgi:hypothetical protein